MLETYTITMKKPKSKNAIKHSTTKTNKMNEEANIAEYDQCMYTSGDSGGTCEVGRGTLTPSLPEEMQQDSALLQQPQLPITIDPNHLSLRNKTNLISQPSCLSSKNLLNKGALKKKEEDAR